MPAALLLAVTCLHACMHAGTSAGIRWSERHSYCVASAAPQAQARQAASGGTAQVDAAATAQQYKQYRCVMPLGDIYWMQLVQVRHRARCQRPCSASAPLHQLSQCVMPHTCAPQQRGAVSAMHACATICMFPACLHVHAGGGVSADGVAAAHAAA